MNITNNFTKKHLYNFIKSLNTAEMLYFQLEMEMSNRDINKFLIDLNNDYPVEISELRYEALTNAYVIINDRRNVPCFV